MISLKIWLFEDNPIDEELLRSEIPEAGIIRFDPTSESLDSCLQSSLPDLVIVDVMLTAFTGFEVVYKIKSQQSTQKLPIIMVSGAEIFRLKEWAKMAQDIDHFCVIRITRAKIEALLEAVHAR